MTDPLSQAPTRLLDDPSLGGLLRDDLQLASTTAPRPYNVEAGLTRFEQAINAGAAAAAPTGAGLRVLGWIVGATVLVSGGIGAGWMANMIGSAPADHASVIAAAPRADVPVTPAIGAKSPNAGPSAIAAPVPVPAQEPSPASAQTGDNTEPAPALPTTKIKPTPPKPDASPAPTLADEAKQINAGRQLLASDPAKTLAIMQDVAKQFPNGAMIQERTGYTILALVGLNRRAEAEQQADKYLQRWPNGPLAHRVRDALGR